MRAPSGQSPLDYQTVGGPSSWAIDEYPEYDLREAVSGYPIPGQLTEGLESVARHIQVSAIRLKVFLSDRLDRSVFVRGGVDDASSQSNRPP